jgi:topoisomerase-4 subunit B
VLDSTYLFFSGEKNMSETNYNASKIKVLKGLEPVKQLPGMYTRTDNPNHIIYEAIDNAQDEALGGHANKIIIKMPDPYTVIVEDNGRGIPIDIMEEEGGKSAVEVVLTSLHAGGKFDKAGEGAYNFSGGLHGVGVSVTNALSSSLEAIIKKDGKSYRIAFENGDLVSPLTEIGKVPKSQHGTCIIAKPNPKYFDSPIVNVEQLKNYVRVKSALLHDVEISFQFMDDEPILWSYPTLSDYLVSESNKINHEGTYWHNTDEDPVPNNTKYLWNFESYLKKSTLGEDGEGVNLVLGFLQEGKRITESFVNLIPTLNGGTHERGLKNGLFEGLKSFMNFNNLTPQKLNLEAEDLWSRVSFVLSAKLLEPRFQGQTKEKLSSESAAKMVLGLIKDNFEHWLNDNNEFGKKLSEMVIQNAQKRTRMEQPVERKKSTGANILPGKLTDCTETNLERTELFICEGDSAGGGAKMARDKLYQAIFPIRGKILNVWEVEQHKLFDSETIENISLVIGIPPHTTEDKVDFSKLRYGKICTMCDADVDGRHIEVLLLTLFLKHFPQVVLKGHLYVARAPLYRVDYPSSKKGKKADKKEYIQDEQQLDKLLKNLKKDFSEDLIKISRFKGLGEMNPQQLWETTMSPEGRHLIQITMDKDHMDSDIESFNLYMSKKEAKKRKEWMEEKGNTVEVDV